MATFSASLFASCQSPTIIWRGLLGGPEGALAWQIFPDPDALQEEFIECIGAYTAAPLQLVDELPLFGAGDR